MNDSKTNKMSKEKILHAIRQHKPQDTALPELSDFLPDHPSRAADAFRMAVETGGGQVWDLSVEPSLESLLSRHFPHAKTIASSWNGLQGNVDLTSIQSPGELENTDLAMIPAQWGVAENGAVWLTEEDCVHRILPFITQHLLVVLDKNRIVQNMHEAYQRIQIQATGFGVFVAGPSKTADIEQSLVVGAQGARSFTVVITG